MSAVAVSRRRESKLAQSVFRCLPSPMRRALVRRRIDFDASLLERSQVRVASTVADYLAAFHLVHDAYVERGWIKPQPSGLWLTQHHVLPESTVFLVELDGVPVGTATVLVDSNVGLPIDHTYGEEMRALRQSGAVVGEIGSLALARSERRSGMGLLMMASVWRIATAHLDVSDFVIAVSADVATYYEAIFGFTRFGPVRSYSGFGGAASAADDDLVVGLRQPLGVVHRFCVEKYPRARLGRFNLRSFAEMAYPAAHERPLPDVAASMDLARVKLSRAVFQELFTRRTDLLAQLDERTRKHLERYRSRETLDIGAVTQAGTRVSGAAQPVTNTVMVSKHSSPQRALYSTSEPKS